MSAQDLWGQVLLVALTDALNGLPTDASGWHAGTRQDARGYILSPNPDFDMVCHLAGVEPEAVRGRFRRLVGGAKGTACVSMSASIAVGRKYTYKGQACTLREWAERTGMPYELPQTRLTRRGWPIGRALTEPVVSRRPKLGRSELDQATRILEHAAARLPSVAGVDAAYAAAGPAS